MGRNWGRPNIWPGLFLRGRERETLARRDETAEPEETGGEERSKTKLATTTERDGLQRPALPIPAAPSAPERHRHCYGRLVPNLLRPRSPPPPPAGARVSLRPPAGDAARQQLRPPRLVRRREGGSRTPRPRRQQHVLLGPSDGWGAQA